MNKTHNFVLYRNYHKVQEVLGEQKVIMAQMQKCHHVVCGRLRSEMKP